MTKRIAVYSNTKSGHGGGFDQAINYLTNISKNLPEKTEILIFSRYAWSTPQFEVKTIRLSFLDKFFIFMATNLLFLWVIKKLSIMSSFEKKLLKENVDVIYFSTPGIESLAIVNTPVISTVFDLCHRDVPDAPEVSGFGESRFRELQYQHSLRYSTLVVTDSMLTKDKLKSYYNVDPEKIIIIPFSPSSDLLSLEKEGNSNDGIEGDYFFYPAQYWPHKNHIVILRALNYLLKNDKISRKVIFTGKDYGMLNFLREKAVELQVSEYIEFKSFVETKELLTLYKNCFAVIMPSYFGPTNLPPLEAFHFGKPLIYTQDFDMDYQACLAIDPDDHITVVKAMLDIENLHLREKLVSKSKIFLRNQAALTQSNTTLLSFEIQKILNRNFSNVTK